MPEVFFSSPDVCFSSPAACFSSPGHGQRLSLDDFRLCIDGKSSGAVRASVGLVSNFEDIQGFLHFAETLLE